MRNVAQGKKNVSINCFSTDNSRVLGTKINHIMKFEKITEKNTSMKA